MRYSDTVLIVAVFAAVPACYADPPATPPSEQWENDMRRELADLHPALKDEIGRSWPIPVSNIELVPVADKLATRYDKAVIPELVHLAVDLGRRPTAPSAKTWDNPGAAQQLAILTVARMGKRQDIAPAFEELLNREETAPWAYVYASYLPDQKARKVMEAVERGKTAAQRHARRPLGEFSMGLAILQIAGDKDTLKFMADLRKDKGGWSDFDRQVFDRQVAKLRDRLLEPDAKKVQASQDLERRWFQAYPHGYYFRKEDESFRTRAVVLEQHGIKFPPEFLCDELLSPGGVALLAKSVLIRMKDEAAIPRLLQIAALRPDTPVKENAVKLAKEVLEKYDPNAIARARKPSSKP